MSAYRILRFFNDGRPSKRIKVVSSLALAQLHCNDKRTRGELRSGVRWFDGFREIKRKAPPVGKRWNYKGYIIEQGEDDVCYSKDGGECQFVCNQRTARQEIDSMEVES